MSTLSTIVLNKYINTGDRLLDGALVSILLLLVTYLIKLTFNNARRVYNILIYYLYKQYKTPWNMEGVPYFPKTVYAMSNETFNNMLVKKITGFRNVSNEVRNKTMRSFHFHNNPCIRSNNDKWTTKFCSRTDGHVYDCFEYGYYMYLAGFTKAGYEIFVNISGVFYTFDTDDNLGQYVNLFCEEFCARANSTDSKLNLSISSPHFSNDGLLTWNFIGTVSVRKTFDHLFYDQKPQLIELLKKFQSITMYPSNIPMDNKLGILLYGPPGTGKTGTISAIANMLKRNICVINFTVVRTCDELDAILTPKLYQENMFVFDEIDCILDALTKDGSRTNTSDIKTSSDWGSMLLCAEGDERKEILKVIKSEQTRKRANIDLAYLLQKLDGLESAEGRLIIATTNHPEKINPALLRPGRFDLKLELGNCSKAMYIDIIASFYKNDQKIRQRVAAANLPEFKHSPLMVINHAMREPNLDKLLRLLKK